MASHTISCVDDASSHAFVHTADCMGSHCAQISHCFNHDYGCKRQFTFGLAILILCNLVVFCLFPYILLFNVLNQKKQNLMISLPYHHMTFNGGAEKKIFTLLNVTLNTQGYKNHCEPYKLRSNQSYNMMTNLFQGFQLLD